MSLDPSPTSNVTMPSEFFFKKQAGRAQKALSNFKLVSSLSDASALIRAAMTELVDATVRPSLFIPLFSVLRQLRTLSTASLVTATTLYFKRSPLWFKPLWTISSLKIRSSTSPRTSIKLPVLSPEFKTLKAKLKPLLNDPLVPNPF